jgi:hypothetical protein
MSGEETAPDERARRGLPTLGAAAEYVVAVSRTRRATDDVIRARQTLADLEVDRGRMLDAEHKAFEAMLASRGPS